MIMHYNGSNGLINLDNKITMNWDWPEMGSRIVPIKLRFGTLLTKFEL